MINIIISNIDKIINFILVMTICISIISIFIFLLTLYILYKNKHKEKIEDYLFIMIWKDFKKLFIKKDKKKKI